MREAVFIDKDGTLIPDIPYNVDPKLITLQHNAAEGLKKLKKMNFLLIVVSNQAGVARGFFKEQELNAVEKKLRLLLAAENIEMDGFYYCPHHPEGKISGYITDCLCRKPKAGLLLKAAADFNIDLSQSWMIGDILNDVEAGNRAGCRTILINNGNETEWLVNAYRRPDYIASSINHAACLIHQFKKTEAYEYCIS